MDKRGIGPTSLHQDSRERRCLLFRGKCWDAEIGGVLASALVPHVPGATSIIRFSKKRHFPYILAYFWHEATRQCQRLACGVRLHEPD